MLSRLWQLPYRYMSQGLQRLIFKKAEYILSTDCWSFLSMILSSILPRVCCIYHTQRRCFNRQSSKRSQNIIGGLPSIGVHHNNQFAFGHDGRRYTLLHQQHDLASWMDVSLVVKCRTRLIQWKHPLDIYAYIILIYPFG